MLLILSGLALDLVTETVAFLSGIPLSGTFAGGGVAFFAAAFGGVGFTGAGFASAGLAGVDFAAAGLDGDGFAAGFDFAAGLVAAGFAFAGFAAGATFLAGFAGFFGAGFGAVFFGFAFGAVLAVVFFAISISCEISALTGVTQLGTDLQNFLIQPRFQNARTLPDNPGQCYQLKRPEKPATAQR
ncbi:MAG TPA: hypothetical protein VGE69_13660 [Pseudomonadales bacterium]